MSPLRWLVPVVLASASAGCGGSTATVSGTVTYQGRTVTSGSVIVVNEDGTAGSCAIQPSGAYSVSGVKRGRVKIGIFSPEPARAHSIRKSRDPGGKRGGKQNKKRPGAATAADEGWFPIPRQLGNPDTSGVTCEVTQSRVRFDLELK
ncbi:MAG TPA: hypothetical protein VGF55_24500 [Gemmataceae bacterium]|jgi:hypothetical protein